MSVKVFLIYFLNSSLRPYSNNFIAQKITRWRKDMTFTFLVLEHQNYLCLPPYNFF